MDFGRIWGATSPYLGKLAWAAAILLAGLCAANLLKFIVCKAVRRGKSDPMVGRFMSSLLFSATMIVALAAALGELGVQTASIVAIIGAAGIAVGLALQNSLANLASGIILVALKPFSAGDYVEAGDKAGTVIAVGLFTTTLRTFDGIKVVLPNSRLTDGPIVNYSTHPERRFDTSVSVAYSTNLDDARRVLLDLFARDPRILALPAPVVSVDSLSDSGMVLGIRVWTLSKDYWPVRFGLLADVKAALDGAGIEIPFPQRVIHLENGH